jgi:hypothetical protein
MPTRKPAHGQVCASNERVQPPRVAKGNSSHARIREACDAHNPPGPPEEEGALRWIQEKEEPQMSRADSEWPDWNVEDEPDFDADELGIDPEEEEEEEEEMEEESDAERDRRYQ